MVHVYAPSVRTIRTMVSLDLSQYIKESIRKDTLNGYTLRGSKFNAKYTLNLVHCIYEIIPTQEHGLFFTLVVAIVRHTHTDTHTARTRAIHKIATVYVHH